MKFDDIALTFERGPSGTNQFKAFYRSAFDLMKSDPDNAAMYFVVGVAAQAYVMMYEDQAVEPAFADAAKDVLVGFNRRLVATLQQEPGERLRVASAVAIEYEWHVHKF